MKVWNFIPMHQWIKLQKDEIIDIVKEAGVVGMGGAGFPTHVKLSPKVLIKLTM